MKLRTLAIAASVIGALGAAVWLVPEAAPVKTAVFWQRLASPGPLSKAHENLECGDCHTAVAGAERTRCVICHANNEEVLSRQPTSFHAHIGSCAECHVEHRGFDAELSEMSHCLLARLALRSLEAGEAGLEGHSVAQSIDALVARGVAPHVGIDPMEAALDCMTCHSNEDPHFGLFGQECQQCHLTTSWTLHEFKHPSPRSKDCNQCHQAPPSHYKMHFKMVSARVARKPHARVEDCYECHETTSWNDIVGVGWYKHH